MSSNELLPNSGLSDGERAALDRSRAPGRATLTQRLQRRAVPPPVLTSVPPLDAGALVQRHAIQDAELATAMGFVDAPARVVQRRGDAHTGLEDHDVRAIAAEGVAGGGGALPHLAAIQRSFGGHDVSGVRAHVGGAAATASDALGAEAYATGSSVAFRESPSLFVAAHEAAHVVQQRGGVQFSGAVGQAGDAYEQHADLVAARVVAGESAEDLLGHGAHGGGAVVQRKDAPPKEEHEAPTQTQAAQATGFAVRSHIKLTAMRMFAAASNMRALMDTPANTDAGVEPIVQGLQANVDAVMNDLDRLESEITKVPGLLNGSLEHDFSPLYGAWHDPRGIAAALNRAHSFTHDQSGRLMDTHASYTATTTLVQDKVHAVLVASKVDIGNLKTESPTGAQLADLGAAFATAATEALDDGIYAVKMCVGRLTADLDAPDSQRDEAAELVVAFSTIEGAAKGIDAKHLGALTQVIRETEKLQAELDKRTDPRSKAIARRIGYNSAVSSSLFAVKQQMTLAASKKHH